MKRLFYVYASILLVLIIIGLLARATTGQTLTEKPSVTVCDTETHSHTDEDTRIRSLVRFSKVSPCGFNWETKDEVGHLNYFAGTTVAWGETLTDKAIVTATDRSDIRNGGLAMILFCNYCQTVLHVRLYRENKEKE